MNATYPNTNHFYPRSNVIRCVTDADMEHHKVVQATPDELTIKALLLTQIKSWFDEKVKRTQQ